MATEYKNPQTELRMAMQRNGYAWVPNNGKRTRGRDWPQKALDRLNNPFFDSAKWWDEATIEPEDGGAPFHIENPSTGLLVEGDLIALDVDIDNEAAVTMLFNHARSIFGAEWADHVLLRIREGEHKECWLFRVGAPRKHDETFPRSSKLVGPRHFFAPGTDVEKDAQCCETKNGWARSESARSLAHD